MSTEEIENIEYMRGRMGLDTEDDSRDAVIFSMSPMDRVRLIAGWKLGSDEWADQFKHWFEGQGLYLTTNADDPNIIY